MSNTVVPHPRTATGIFGVILILVSFPLVYADVTSDADGDLDSSTGLVVVCAPEHIVVQRGETVRLRSWALSGAGQPLHGGTEFHWSARAGTLKGAGAIATWNLASLAPADYAAEVTVNMPEGESATCKLNVIIDDAQTTPGDPNRAVEAARAYLLLNKHELNGYGLYSYLLFAEPPTATVRTRYVEAIKAYLDKLNDRFAVERYFPRSEMNLVYLPITMAPPNRKAPPTPEWVLGHYDFPRARMLLNQIDPALRDGPYIVASLKRPLGVGATVALKIDLSKAQGPELEALIKDFLDIAAGGRGWNSAQLRHFLREIRTIVGSVARGGNAVIEGMDNVAEIVDKVKAR